MSWLGLSLLFVEFWRGHFFGHFIIDNDYINFIAFYRRCFSWLTFVEKLHFVPSDPHVTYYWIRKIFTCKLQGLGKNLLEMNQFLTNDNSYLKLSIS